MAVIMTINVIGPSRANDMSPIAFLERYGGTPATAKKPPHHAARHQRLHYIRHYHTRHSTVRATIRAMVADSARRHGVPVSLALGVAHVESGFRPRWNGIAAGVMQIRPATARSVGCSGRVHDLMRPAYGVECGMRYLALVLHRAGSRYRAAALYTQGIGARRVSRAGAHYAHMVLAATY